MKGKEGCLGKSHYALWPTLRKTTHLNLQGSFVQPSRTVVKSILNIKLRREHLLKERTGTPCVLAHQHVLSHD